MIKGSCITALHKSDSITESPGSSVWYLYVVRTAGGMLYTGISTDPARRLRQHNGELSGGAKALRGKGPSALIWQQPFADRKSAARAEYQFKQLSRQAKLQHINQVGANG